MGENNPRHNLYTYVQYIHVQFTRKGAGASMKYDYAVQKCYTE